MSPDSCQQQGVGHKPSPVLLLREDIEKSASSLWQQNGSAVEGAMRVVEADQHAERCLTRNGIEDLMPPGDSGVAVGKESSLAGFVYELLQLTL